MSKIDITVNGQRIEPQVTAEPKEDLAGMIVGLGIIFAVCLGWIYQLSIR